MNETCFAPAERTDEDALFAEIQIVSKAPLLSGLLHSISGLMAVLDERRQIVAVNDAFLTSLGIDDPAKALGLRPGEALHCIHAYEHPAGCGTTKYCTTCGAAMAIVSSLGREETVERICALSCNRDGREQEIALLVRSHPITISDRRFLLLFLQDITLQQRRAALERTFYHDINNMLNVMVGVSELLVREKPTELTEAVYQAALRLTREIAIQKYLSDDASHDYQPTWTGVSAERIFDEIRTFFANHPAAHGKTIDMPDDFPRMTLRTDVSLLSRILCNMIINALEATDNGGVVKFWLEYDGNRPCFSVWNGQDISPDVARRIFQRNFSTKDQAGRGLGTFSMKLLGENILGGDVDFTSSEQKGTTFRFRHPV